MVFTRLLQYRFPLIRGEDVIAVQDQLRLLGYATGTSDGIYGPRTEQSIRKFQEAQQLRPDGMVGPLTWNKLFNIDSDSNYQDRLKGLLPELTQPHSFRDSISWALTPTGISINGAAPERTKGNPDTTTRIWRDFRVPIVQWSETLGVPVELIIATIGTESSGNPNVHTREEPGYVSDEATPHRVSPGIMQTLISTARAVVGDQGVDRAWLQQPANSIQAGTSYIASQWKQTHFDPPKVACAYNAGGLHYNQSNDNRWKLRQYPIGSSEHADRFIKWFNDSFEVLGKETELPEMSFVKVLS